MRKLSRLCILTIQERRIRWEGHVVRIVKMRNAYKILVEKHEGKKQLGRPRRGWENNIKMAHIEILCEGVDWITLA
jgi:hypothetical protein